MPEPAQIVFDVADMEFEEKVLRPSGERPVAVEFHSERCGACRALAPALRRVIESFGGAMLLARVQVERAPRIAAGFGIRATPTVVVVRDGEPVGQFMGALPEGEISRALQRFLPSEADGLVERAASLAREGRAAEAEALYREALGKDGNHQGALAGLALLALERGELDAARDMAGRIHEGTPEHDVAERVLAWVEFRERCGEVADRATAERRLSEDPDDLDAAFALGTCLAAEGDYEGALERFLGILQKDKGYGGGGAREAMVRVFSIVGKRSELADRYRSRMAAVLY